MCKIEEKVIDEAYDDGYANGYCKGVDDVISILHEYGNITEDDEEFIRRLVEDKKDGN